MSTTQSARVREFLEGIGGMNRDNFSSCIRLIHPDVWVPRVSDNRGVDEIISLITDRHRATQYDRLVVWAELSGPVDFEPLVQDYSVSWLILSGSSTQPTDLDGLRRVIADCREAGAKVWVRSLGVKTYFNDGRGVCDDSTYVRFSDPSEWPEWARLREVPKCLEG